MNKIAAGLVLVLIISIQCASAQQYQTGVGFRFGFDNGVTVKHFIADKNAIEGILSFYREGLLITGLYEIQNNKAFKVEELDWFYGAGGHLGFWGDDHSPYEDDHSSTTVLGIDGIIGVEYVFKEAPISLSLDFKPILNLIGDAGVYGNLGFSVRYTIK